MKRKILGANNRRRLFSLLFAFLLVAASVLPAFATSDETMEAMTSEEAEITDRIEEDSDISVLSEKEQASEDAPEEVSEESENSVREAGEGISEAEELLTEENRATEDASENISEESSELSGTSVDEAGRDLPQTEEELPEEETLTEAQTEAETKATQEIVLCSEGKNYTVEVRFGPEAGLSENVKLVAERITAELDSEHFAQREEALRDLLGSETAVLNVLFDIGFEEDGQPIEPKAPVDVTITLPADCGLAEKDAVAIVHYAAEGPERLDDTIVTKDKNGAALLQFEAKSFSEYGVSLAEEEAPEIIYASFVSLGAAPTHFDIANYLGKTKNGWQIIEYPYENNSASAKIGNDRVRVQKNVISTDKENEFLMYLSVDLNRESILTEFFEGVGIVYTPSNPVKEYGKYWPSGDAAKADNAVRTNADDGNMRIFSRTSGQYTWTINITAGGKTYTITRYASSGSFSNGHIVMKVGNGWMTVGDAAKKNANAILNINITDSVLGSIMENITDVSLGTVIDTMGHGIQASEIIYATGGAVIKDDGKRIEWNPKVSSVGSQSGWYENIAELAYRISYTPSVSTGLKIGQDSMIAKEATAEAAKTLTNSSATLTYNITSNGRESTATIDFPQPVIRGLLYEINGSKTDGQHALEGAIFGLYSDPSCQNELKRMTTDANGRIDFSNLQYGTYYVKEISAPREYIPDEEIYQFDLCYTNKQEALIGQGEREEALNKDAATWTVINTTASKIALDITKYGTTQDVPLSGAEFKIYLRADEPEVATGISGTDGKIAFDSAVELEANTTYILKETKAPVGYQKTDDITIAVTDNETVSVTQEGENYDYQLKENTLYLSITDEAVYDLPETGRAGIYPLMFIGIVIMCCTATGLMLLMQRRRDDGA